MEDEKPADQPHAGDIKKLILTRRPRVAVETSQGPLFARHLDLSDLTTFQAYVEKDKAGSDLETLGSLLLKTLICVNEVGAAVETRSLTDEVYNKLQADDLRALADGVAQANQAAKPQGQEPLAALGAVMFDQLAKYARRMAESKKQMTDAAEQVQQRFGGMSTSVKAALADSLSGMSAIRESLRSSAAVEAFLKVQKDQETAADQMSEDYLRPMAAVDALRKAGKAGLTADIRAQLDRSAGGARVEMVESFAPKIEYPRIQDTPMGRAAIAGEESARQLQEVAGLVGQMTDRLGQFHTLFLVEVIPQWVKNLEDSAQSTNTSIGLAKKAIYLSIAVTILMTAWQVWIAHDYKVENDKAQEASEALIRQQLNAAKDLNRQLAEDSTRLREEVAKLNQAVLSLQRPASKEGVKKAARDAKTSS